MVVECPIPNFRPLTTKPNLDGRTPKEGLIFRSGSPVALARRAAREIEALGIQHIYDFRFGFEIEREGTLDLAGVATTPIDVIGGTGLDLRNVARMLDDPERVILALYRDVFPDRPAFGLFLRSVLAQASPGFLFHCTAGKDRTGIAGVILMYVLGYGENDIYDEYLTIDPAVVEQVAGQMSALASRTGRTLDAEALGILASVRPRFLDAFHEGVVARHGSIRQYVREFLKVSDNDSRVFRDRYLRT